MTAFGRGTKWPHPCVACKWLISRRMAEMSHPSADIFFRPCEFQLCRRFRKAKLKDLWIRPSRLWRTGTEKKEVRYEVSEIFGAGWIANDAAGVLAGGGQNWRGHRVR